MHRILISFGPFHVFSYGLMLALAFILGTYIAQRRAARYGITAENIIDLILWILISSIIGARLFYVVLDWRYYAHNPVAILKLWEGGLVFYGGFIFGFLAALYYLRRRKLNFWAVADALAPSLALGVALGRIGCFLNGCCYGKVSLRWGMLFPSGPDSLVFVQQVRDGLIHSDAACPLPVLPTQLYSAAAAVALLCILLWLGRKPRFGGFLFLVFVLLYSIGRFFIEGVRYYEGNYRVIGSLTISQIISIALLSWALIMLWARSRKQQQKKLPQKKH